jgi:hypothetical protein
MQRLIPLALICLFLAPRLHAESLLQHPSERPRSRFWRASIVSLLAASALDTHSSFHRYEANPLLRSADGRFRYQGFVIKAAITGGSIGAQYLLLRRGPRAETRSALINFGLSGVLTGAAIHNYGNPRPPR